MVKWEYLYLDVVPTGLYGELLPRYKNGIEIPDWKSGLPVPELMNRLGEVGWELVASNPIWSRDGWDRLYWVYIFKRPR